MIMRSPLDLVKYGETGSCSAETGFASKGGNGHNKVSSLSVTMIGHFLSFLKCPSLHETLRSRLNKTFRPFPLVDGPEGTLPSGEADPGPA